MWENEGFLVWAGDSPEELFGEVLKVGGVKFLGNLDMTSVI